jgi:DNA invertase Pin-like site-specific DNA recombinase
VWLAQGGRYSAKGRLTTPHGQLMLTILGGLAEFERTLIRARTGEGRERAKARGVRPHARAPYGNNVAPLRLFSVRAAKLAAKDGSLQDRDNIAIWRVRRRPASTRAGRRR